MSKKILILRSRIVAFPIAFWCSAPQLQNSILPFRWARNYSTWRVTQHSSLENLKLNPWFVCSGKYMETSLNEVKRTGKIYKSISFWSKALPMLNEFYQNFYVDKVKIVPLDLSLLTPLDGEGGR